MARGFAGGVGVGVTAAHEFIADAELRGFGGPVAKSVALLSVSVQPLFNRCAAEVLPGVEVGPLPSKQLAPLPKPAKSMIAGLLGQELLSSVVLLTNATLPVVALMPIAPVASGVAKLAVPPVPWASWTR